MITSTSNAQIKELAKLQKKSRLRDEKGIFLVEGPRMTEEIPTERIEKVYASESFAKKNKEFLERLQAPVELLTDTVFAYVSDTKTPQGILAIVKRLSYTMNDLMQVKDQKAPHLIVLDNLQDPGNLGTIFRTAEAAGVTGILLSKDCVDVYNPKVIRSTMGAVFRMPFLYVEDLPEKIKELQEFISRFSANASKSKQATSRKRALEKIQLDDIRPSSRKYPYIDFRPNREIGNEVLTVDGISKTIDGVKVLDNISFIVGHDDKIAFVGGNELAKTTLFKILAGEMEPDEGSYKWGVTTSQSYFPKDNTAIFDSDELIVDWLTQYSEIKDATYVRGFLGRMLFAGEDGVKKMRVLSGGEKVRVLLSRMMIMGSNVLIFDEPTDHLDMESITALNNGMIKFPGVILFACRDHQVVQTTANRIIEFLPDGSMVDKVSTYDEYLESDVMARKRQVYNTTADEEADD